MGPSESDTQRAALATTIVPNSDGLATEGSPQGADGSPLSRGHLVGRYVVLEELGVGAMGRVFSAFDPQLDRRIALKVLRLDASLGPMFEDAQQRLLAEAQALARLRHPHVVGVHDVQRTEHGLAIAMDLIDGVSLRQWLDVDRREWPEVLAVIRQAAAGLAAAHTAGLVHRDFKPDNVMIDATGAARVVDFGLARAFDRSDDTARTGAAAAEDAAVGGPTVGFAGTPAYMAPEQHASGAVGPAADQFALCVTLYEALWGVRPFDADNLAALARVVLMEAPRPPPRGTVVPRPIREAVMRGLSRAPEDRFESMQQLWSALDHDPAILRRRIGLGVATLAMAGFVAYAVMAPAGPRICEGGRARAETSWNDGQRTAVRAGLEASGRPFARPAAQRAIDHLDAWTAEWAQMHDDSCRATRIQGVQSTRMLDLRTACLERQRQSLDATVRVLASADAEVAERATEVVGALPGVAACADTDALDAAVKPPPDAPTAEAVARLRARLADAGAWYAAGKYGDARTIVDEIAADIEVTDYAPLRAEYGLARGNVLDSLGESEASEPILAEAAWTAQRAGDDTVMARAMTQLVYVVGVHLERTDDGLLWAEHAAAAADRVDDPSLRARVLQHRGAVLTTAGRFDAAYESLQRALALSIEVDGEDGLNTAAVRGAFATVLQELGRGDESRAQSQRVLATFERVHGPDHPRVGAMLHNIGLRDVEAGRTAAGSDKLERALSIFVASLGPEHPNVANAWSSIASARYARDDLAGTAVALEKALSIWRTTRGDDHPSVAFALKNLAALAFQSDDLVRAEAHYRHALSIAEARHGPDHVSVGEMLVDLGIVLRWAHRLDEAEPIFARADTILAAAMPDDHPTRAKLDKVLAEVATLRGDEAEAERLAARALASFQRHPEDMPWNRGHARFLLARAKWAQGDHDPRWVAQVRLAQEEVGDDNAQARTEIVTWLSAHG